MSESLLEARVRKLEADLAELHEEVLNDRAARFAADLATSEQVQSMSRWLADILRAAAAQGCEVPPLPEGSEGILG